jgi:hypothetical protein
MLGVAACMYFRQVHREFPFFFNYAILQVLIFCVEFWLRDNANLYFYVSWITTALSISVAFAVLLEIFREAFRPYEALRDLSLILFRWCALVVFLVAGMWAVTSWRSAGIDNVNNTLYLVTRCVRMMQCGLVLFLILFSEHLGISRRNLVFGVSIGFGFFAAVNMLVMTAASHHSVVSKHSLNRINSLAWIASMVIWLIYAAVPSTVRKPAEQAVDASQKWDLALDEVRNSAPAVGLLDSIDQTVDRLLYDRPAEASVTVPNRQ